MVIVSDDEGSGSDAPPPKKARPNLNGTTKANGSHAAAKLGVAPANPISSMMASLLGETKVQFLSREERQKGEEEQAERERRQQRQKEIDASRRRKQFLFLDPREADRQMRQRQRRRGDEEREVGGSGAVLNPEQMAQMAQLVNSGALSGEKLASMLRGSVSSSSGYVSAKTAAALDNKNPNVPSTAKKVEDSGGEHSMLKELNLIDINTGSSSELAAPQLSAYDLQQVKKQYLGVQEEKRRIQKPSEKFRTIFNFEWNAGDDTFGNDTNDLYTNRPDPQLLFGRGYRAGIDVRDQRRKNDFYENLIKRRAERGGEEVGTFISRREKVFETRLTNQEGVADHHNVHWSEKELNDMTVRDWKIFREDHGIFLRGGRVPNPMRKWTESNLPLELLDAVNKAGYTKPRPVQMQAIPIAMQLRDLIASAETGSGKTASYCLPLLAYLHKLPQLDAESAQAGPYGVILCPSRELANQISAELDRFKFFIPHIRTVTLVGGTDAEKQAFQIRVGVELIVATPGRLADSLTKQHTVLHQCNYVILDEVDMMLESPMDDFVYRILNSIPSTNMKSEDEEQAYKQELELQGGSLDAYRRFRITQMYTATLSTKAEKLARTYCRCPAIIRVGTDEIGSGVARNKDIEQRVKVITEADKKKECEMLFNEADFNTPCIIFVNTKKAAEVLARWVDSLGYRVQTFHAGRSQAERDSAMKKFRDNQLDFLCATNVLGRGIDIEGLPWIINFDAPATLKEYGHRIGRTGRAGKKGIAATFLTEGDKEVFWDLKQYLIDCQQEVPVALAHSEHARVKPGTLTEGGRLAGKGGGNVIYSK